MDFIERWFGVSPDGGDGSLEALIVMSIAVVVAAFVSRKQLRQLFDRTRRLSR